MSQTSFLVASGFLTAILLVWAQLWVSTAQAYRRRELSTWTVGYGLTYIYWAIGASLVAFVIGIICEPLPGAAFGFFAFSLLVATVQVGQSLLSVSKRMWSGSPLDRPLISPNSKLVKNVNLRRFLIVGLPILILILSVLLCSLLLNCHE